MYKQLALGVLALSLSAVAVNADDKTNVTFDNQSIRTASLSYKTDVVKSYKRSHVTRGKAKLTIELEDLKGAKNISFMVTLIAPDTIKWHYECSPEGISNNITVTYDGKTTCTATAN